MVRLFDSLKAAYVPGSSLHNILVEFKPHDMCTATSFLSMDALSEHVMSVESLLLC